MWAISFWEWGDQEKDELTQLTNVSWSSDQLQIPAISTNILLRV